MPLKQAEHERSNNASTCTSIHLTSYSNFEVLGFAVIGCCLVFIIHLLPKGPFVFVHVCKW